MRTLRLCGAGVILGLVFLAAEAPATTYYVATNGLDTRTGLGDWTNAVATISNAVAKAQTNSANIVLVSNGTYLTVAQIVITNAITVRSWNNGAVDRTNTVVQRSGAANHRIFYVSNTEAIVEGLTITNGNASTLYYEGTGVWLDRGGTLRNCLITGNANTNPYNYSGGGVRVSQSGTVDNCLVIGNNNGWYAGGIHMQGGGLVTNCQIVSNVGNYNYAGGIFVETGGVVVASTIIGNSNSYSAGYGGGVLVGTNSVVRDCTISYNTIVTRGGGVAVFAGGLVENCTIQSNLNTDTNGTTRSGAGLFFNYGGEARNCLISGNSGTNGGGVYFVGGGVARNCLVKENVGTISGGGVYFADSSGNGGTLLNSTVVSNVAVSYGGGIYNDARASSNTPVLIENCVIYQNSAGVAAYSNYYNWITTLTNYAYTNCLTAPTNSLLAGSGNISLNPQFVDPAGGNYRLQRGSPCVNTGVNRDWMPGTFDLDGHYRLDKFNGIVDRGCYEYVFPGTMIRMR